MEYLEYLEHTQTLMEAWANDLRNAKALGLSDAPLLATIRVEIQNERRRGELALAIEKGQSCGPTTTKDPFRCAQCGEVIMYGERQHVCRGE